MLKPLESLPFSVRQVHKSFGMCHLVICICVFKSARDQEYHKPFFDTLEKLFCPPLKKVIEESFVSEHMIIDVKIMKEMISNIETNKNLCGDTFFERILRIIDKNSFITGFSEYETHGTYICTKYPEKVEFRYLRTNRVAKVYFGNSPKIEDLEWAGADYDTISFEGFESEWFIPFLWRNTFVQAHFHMESVGRIVFPMIWGHHAIRRTAKNSLCKLKLMEYS